MHADQFAFVVINLILFTSISQVKSEKRLLINDPDVLQAEIAQLKQQFTDLTNKLNTEITDLKRHIHQQDQIISAKGQGSMYVRWGRTQCNDSQSELVYSGYAAGQLYLHSNHYGGPSNTLCLPTNPELSNQSYTSDDSLTYGTEFERNTFASNSHNEDVPCAVCRNPSTTSSLMIAGRKTCYPGWHSEYSGFIASNSLFYSASEYLCVDRDPEYIASGKRDDNGNLLYQTNIRCGALPCPPYEENRKLPCVVCSR